MIEDKRCAYITLLGSPNVGKSTLLNELIGNKISIVSPKVQTTRNRINGICISDNSQLIFVDTPGIFIPKAKLDSLMVKSAWSSIEDSDFAVVLIDSKRGICDNSILVLERLKLRNIRPILILNKIDLLPAKQLLSLTEELSSKYEFSKVFMISALTGSGVADVRQYFTTLAPVGEWLFDEDEITTASKRFLATEIVREQVFLNLHQELPYNLTVDTEVWEDRLDGSVKINLVIFVAKASHKMILLGHSGDMIKRISKNSRLEMEKLLQQKVHLYLFVKINENWLDEFINHYQ